MTPSEVAESYNQIAPHWASDQFDRTNGMRAHLRALQFVGQPGPALDVGCGASGRFIDLLMEHNFTPQGLDISAAMLALATQRHPTITFHEANIVTWEPVQEYTFISAWDSIWHVPLEQQADVLHKLIRTLTPGGVFIFSSGGTIEPDFTLDDAMGVPMYHASLGIPQLLRIIEAAGAHCVHLEFDQHPQLHTYFIVQRAA